MSEGADLAAGVRGSGGREVGPLSGRVFCRSARSAAGAPLKLAGTRPCWAAETERPTDREGRFGTGRRRRGRERGAKRSGSGRGAWPEGSEVRLERQTQEIVAGNRETIGD